MDPGGGLEDENAIVVKNMITGQANVQKIKQIYPTDNT